MGEQAGNTQDEIRHKKEKPVIPRFFIALVLTVLVYLLGLEAWHWFSSRLVDIQPLQKGVLVQEIPAKAVLIKSEISIKAPAGGKIEMLVKDGDRIRLGSAIARITGVNGTVTVYSPRAGLLCRHLDGLEGTLRPENINVLDINTIEKIGISDNKLSAVREVEKGIPFCKLVDNLEPLFMYLRLDEKTSWEMDEFERRERFDLIWQGERISANVLETRGKAEYLLEINDYPEKLLHMRQIDVQAIVNELKGYPVSYDALVFRENQAGILVIEQKSIKWVPVEIAGRMNGKVVLNENGLGVNTQYVINPGWVEETSGVEW